MFQDLEDKSTSFEVLPRDSMEEVRIDEFLLRTLEPVSSCVLTDLITSFYF